MLALQQPVSRYADPQEIPARPTVEIARPDMDMRRASQAVDASIERDRSQHRRLTLQLAGRLPRPIELHVGVYDATSGSRLARRALPQAWPAELSIDKLPARRLTLYIGAHAESLRRSYLFTQVVAADAAPQTTLPIELELRTFSLQIHADEPSPRTLPGVPVWIRRVDDPLWRHLPPGAINARATVQISDADGWVHFEALGPGDFEAHCEGLEILTADRPKLLLKQSDPDLRRQVRGQRP